ncbi:MAG TPA: penicillin-insensitive murein endopeptidase [Gaiella sp.]|nr:penicillin-insensitive murein endopeptidase [Gaiella sp.]
MGWRLDEVWLDTDVLWFPEQPRRPFGLALPVPAVAGERLEPALFMPAPTVLEAPRRRQPVSRRRRLATRTVPAVALVLGSATMIPIAVFRQGGAQGAGPLQADPPSLTFRPAGARFVPPAEPAPRKARAVERETELGRIEFHRATSFGLQYAGHLVDGTQLPVEGPDWITWNPLTDSVPNQPNRLYGHERTIRAILSVVAAYRTAHPDAPRVVIGDISFPDGGRMNEHLSHQNGLDVDVYYPRLDRHLRAPTATDQIDRGLAQDLLDRFLGAGARIVFVGYSTDLRGLSGVVVPYPNHENHMHLRFPSPHS